MCLIAEVQRFRDATYRVEDEYALGQRVKEWFRNVFALPSGQAQRIYDFVDEWLESLEDMEDNGGRLKMSAAMWLHERRLMGRVKMPRPLLLRQ